MKEYVVPFILGLVAYVVVSLVSYSSAASLYAAVAAGIVASAATRGLGRAAGIAASAALIGSIAFLIYYWAKAPTELALVFSKLGGFALAPILYGVVASAFAALGVQLLRRS